MIAYTDTKRNEMKKFSDFKKRATLNHHLSKQNIIASIEVHYMNVFYVKQIRLGEINLRKCMTMHLIMNATKRIAFR